MARASIRVRRIYDEPDPDDPQLAFQLMCRLPAELAFKQSLLSLRSEDERLNHVIAYLQRLVRQMTLTLEARNRASRNGHGALRDLPRT